MSCTLILGRMTGTVGASKTGLSDSQLALFPQQNCPAS
jgi:hypothetical protein